LTQTLVLFSINLSKLTCPLERFAIITSVCQSTSGQIPWPPRHCCDPAFSLHTRPFPPKTDCKGNGKLIINQTKD